MRALLISPSFFGYERDICRALEAAGLTVTFRDERPINSSLMKAVFRVGGSLAVWFTRSYYRQLLREFQDTEFELFILIKGEVVPRFFLEELRAMNPDSRFVYYSFDAIAAESNPTKLFDLFDARLSFDPADVAKYDGFSYKPLFYTDEFRPSSGETARLYELTFVGTLHSDRYRFVTNLFRPFDRTLCFLFVQARWFFAAGKYLTRQFSDVSWSEVSFDKLSKSDVALRFRESNAVLDLQRDGQTGLTMRTFEVLASGAILVTANATVRDAEFFDPTRIIVIDDYREVSSGFWLQEQLQAMPTPVGAPVGFESNHVSNWVRELIVGR